MSEKKFESVWRAKWITDDAKTPAEAAAMLRRAAESLETLAAAGITFRAPVDDDYGCLETNDPKLAEQFGFTEVEDEEDEDEDTVTDATS